MLGAGRDIIATEDTEATENKRFLATEGTCLAAATSRGRTENTEKSNFFLKVSFRA